MEIQDHLFAGDKLSFKESPNYGKKFGANLPDTIVIHYTAGSSAESSVRTLCNPKNQASAHLVVGRDGSTTQLVPCDTVAWHAGRSVYADRVGLNRYSIGIEIDNAGRLTKSGKHYASWFGKLYPEDEVIEAVHRNETEPTYWHRFTEEQIATIDLLCDTLIDAYGIKQILGHEEIAPGRKHDPGPAFPLDKLRERLLVLDRRTEEGTKPQPITTTGLVMASKLNIRSSPTLKANKIAPPLSKGTLVEVIDEKNGWYQVEVSMRGWVNKNYVKT